MHTQLVKRQDSHSVKRARSPAAVGLLGTDIPIVVEVILVAEVPLKAVVDIDLVSLGLHRDPRGGPLVVGSGSMDVVVSLGAGEVEVLLGSPNISLSLRGVEVGLGSDVGLLDLGSVVGVGGALSPGYTTLERKLGSRELELGGVVGDLGSLELVAEGGSVGRELTSLGSVLEGGGLDTEATLGSVDTK